MLEKLLPENGEKNGWEEKSVDVNGKFVDVVGDVVVEFISSCVCCLIFGLDKFNGCVLSWLIVLIFSRKCFKLLIRQSIVTKRFSSLLSSCFSSTNESIKLRIMGTVIEDGDEEEFRGNFDWQGFFRRFRCGVTFCSSEWDSLDKDRGDVESFSFDSSIRIISFSFYKNSEK